MSREELPQLIVFSDMDSDELYACEDSDVFRDPEDETLTIKPIVYWQLQYSMVHDRPVQVKERRDGMVVLAGLPSCLHEFPLPDSFASVSTTKASDTFAIDIGMDNYEEDAWNVPVRQLWSIQLEDAWKELESYLNPIDPVIVEEKREEA